MSPTVIDRILSGRRYLRGRRFDRRHGTETTERVSREDLTGILPELREHAGEYAPTDPSLLGRIIRKSGVDPTAFTFVDLGCGKGRALIAAQDHGFRSVVGVEADEALYQTARQNLDRSAKLQGRASVVHGDARTVDLPDGNLFIFMYSPFRGPIFKHVAERLAALAREPGRAMVVAYSADWEGDVLERTGCFTRVRMRRRQFWAPSTVSLFFNEAANHLRGVR